MCAVIHLSSTTDSQGPLLRWLQRFKTLKSNKSSTPRGRSAPQLLARFIELTEEKRRDIIGFAPPPDSVFLDTRAIGQLLSSLADRSQPLQFIQLGAAPEFEHKIEINGLTDQVAERLRFYSCQASVVDEFLSKSDPGVAQAIAQEVKTYYEDSKVAIPDGSDEAANDRYFWMIEKLIPATLTSHPHSQAAYRLAAEIILAKYFESCEVYEHPNSAVTS
jgi:hypothetical protein